MSFTTLLAEHLIIGCFSWAWIVAGLFRIHVLGEYEYTHIKDFATDHIASLIPIVIVLAYPLGTIMSALCYMLANFLFADRINKPLFKKAEVDAFNPVYVYVLQHGSENLVREIDTFASSGMRISRAAAPNCLLLGGVLVTFCTYSMFFYSLISVLIGLAAARAYYVIASEWKAEFFAAHAMLHKDAKHRTESR